MIENPTKFNKMAAFFAAIAVTLVALNSLSHGFFRLINFIETFKYYIQDFSNMVIQLLYISGHFLSLVSAVAVVVVLLRRKKDLIAAIALLLEVAVAILILMPAVIFNAISDLVEFGFSFSMLLYIAIYFFGLLSLIIFRGTLAYSCFTKGKFPGKKLSWLPIAAVGLFVFTTFLNQIKPGYVLQFLEYNGLLEALQICLFPSFSAITVMELIAAVFLGFAFWIPCTETAEVPAEN